MKFYSSLFIILAALLFPSGVFACACCVDVGYYSIRVRKPDSYILDILKKLRFETANIYATPAYPDDIKGITSLAENYSVEGLLSSKSWKFNLAGGNNKSGILNLPLPTTMVDYGADLHNDGNQTVGDVTIYKEWRFKSKVQSATGIFKNGIAPNTEYFLVLQGKGNACPNASDFTHWRLEIVGKKAGYAFFGKLSSRNSDKAEN
ncbi:MAG: hypothetical protein M3Q33_13990 [Acidobacteriota bacterium]|nr:hypothetical protein [Acidobacteriota bacterium]